MKKITAASSRFFNVTCVYLEFEETFILNNEYLVTRPIPAPGPYIFLGDRPNKTAASTYVNFINPAESDIIPSPPRPPEITSIEKSDFPLLGKRLWVWLLWVVLLVLYTEAVFEFVFGYRISGERTFNP